MSAVIRLVTGVLLGCAALVTACTGPVTQPIQPAPGPWREVAAPVPDARVLGFDWLDGEPLATGSVPGPEGRAPAAWLGDFKLGDFKLGKTSLDPSWRVVPLFPRTGYAKQAELVAPAVSGQRLFLRGQAWGGAHGNPRPTLWTGGAGGLDEYQQRFELLGGERAMSSSGTAASPATFVLTGQWDHPAGGPGAAVWVSPDGVDWTQLDDEPALLSAPGEQGRILGVASGVSGFAAVGDVLATNVSPPETTPTAWWSADGLKWRRQPMPGPDGGTNVSAERIACDHRGCVAMGVDTRYDGQGGGSQRLVCWSSTEQTWDAPASPTGQGVTPDQLLSLDGLVLDGDRLLAVTRAGGRPALHSLDRACSTDNVPPLPDAAESLAVLATPGNGILLATTTATRSRLWQLAP